jgi:hypothetical protein
VQPLSWEVRGKVGDIVAGIGPYFLFRKQKLSDTSICLEQTPQATIGITTNISTQTPDPVKSINKD